MEFWAKVEKFILLRLKSESLERKGIMQFFLFLSMVKIEE